MEKMHLEPEGSKTIQLAGGGGHSTKGQRQSLQNMERALKENYGPALREELNRQINFGQASGFTIHKGQEQTPEFWSTYRSQVPAEQEHAIDALMAALMAEPPEGASQEYKVTLSAPELDWIGEEPETVHATVTVPPGLSYAAADIMLKKGLQELEAWGADTTRISWDISW